jgi:two-component system, cell cycle response regulator
MGEKILVVDDSKFNIRLMTDILQAEGYTVYSCEDGRSILEVVYFVKPAAILLDVVMPEIDGFEVCKLLKNDIQTENIPVIMVTSNTNSSDVKKALELGAFDYIKKPINGIEVIARIQSAIRYNEYQEKLKEMALRDGLTGLYNHTFLIELFQKELGKKEKSSTSISFAMIDIDFFKKVNDTYGHLYGDRVLKEVASILRSTFPKHNIIGRYGGEEFGIVFLGLSKEELISTCENIRKNVESTEFKIDSETIRITVSIGACYKDNRENISSGEIIKIADESLYKAKNSGRNKVIFENQYFEQEVI